MLAKLKHGYPQFPNKTAEEKRAAQILFAIILALLATYLVVILTSLYRNDWELIGFVLGGTVLQVVPLGLLARGHLRSSSFIAVLGVLGTATLLATIGQGIHDIAIMAYPVIIIVSGLMMQRRGFIFFSLLTISAVGWLVFGEANGWFIPRPFETTDWADFLIMAAILGVAAIAMNLLAISLRESLNQAQQEIVERKRTEEALTLTQFCVDQASIGILRTDAQSKIISANAQMCQMLGYTADELGNLHVYDLDPSFPFERWKAHRQQLRIQQSDRFETIHRRKDGTTFPVEITTSYIEFKGEGASFTFVQDITERKRAEERLRYLGTHDILTGLYNRTFFEEELARLDRGREFPVSVIVADVDKLKITNDTQGHAAGDELLRRAATVLQSAFRAADILARIGGDEFAILLPNTDAAMAEQAVTRVKSKLAEHNAKYPDLPVQLSLGVATAQQSKLVEALAVADQRMYADKFARQASVDHSSAA